MCVCLCARPDWSPAPPGWGCGAGVCAWAWVAAAPRHSWLGCWGVCVFVCAPRLYPATPGWGVRCGRVCLGSGFGCAPPLLVGASGCVCVCACAPLLPRHSWRRGVCVCGGLGFVCSLVFSWLGCWGAWPLVCAASVSRHILGGAPVAWGCVGVAVGGVCPPASPPLFLSGCGGGCGFVVSVAGCPGLGSRGLGTPFPSRSSCAFVFFFFCFFYPSLPQRGVYSRVRGIFSSGGPLLSVGCRRFLLGCPPVFLRRARWVPSSVQSGGVVCPPLVVWLGGFVAVGLSRTPSPFFWGGSACSSLCLSLGWCTHWSAFGVVNRVAVGACVLLGLAPAPWVGWVVYTLGSLALPVGLGTGSAGWAVAPGSFVRR